MKPVGRNLSTAARAVTRRDAGVAGFLSAVGVLAGILLAVFVVVQDGRAEAQPRNDRLLTADEVVTAFRALGLSVDNVRPQVIGGGPSGPPATESEAFGFSIPGLEPSGGRILVFANDDKLQKKAAWFRRSGATVVVYRNVIVWLDPDLESRVAAEYRRALMGVR